MQNHEERFFAEVELPCKIFCGPESLLEIAGTVVNIGPVSVRLHLEPLAGSWLPRVGDTLRVELVMPVNSDRAKAKYLSVRARVLDVIELPDGRHRLELRFRKPVFKERAEENAASEDRLAPPAQAAHAKWRM